MFQSDNYILGKKLMDSTHMRHKLLSGNLSNLETPGYKRMDIADSFQDKLISAVHRDDFDSIRKMEVRVAKDHDTKSQRADGNNVELDKELMRVNENAMQFEFLSQYTSNSIKALNKAIRGKI